MAPLAAPASAHALEAVGAVDRLVAARLERHLGLAAAARAGRREHLAARPVVAAAVAARAAVVAAAEAVAAGRVAVAAAAAAAATTALHLARAPALRAATGLVGQAAALVELLLPGGECELLTTVAAGQGPVLKHRTRLLQV